jgi:hypothetical protein
MLTEAVIARRGRKDFPLSFRTEVWAECLRFAKNLAQVETALAWVQKAWGAVSREQPLPYLYKCDSFAEQKKEMDKFLAVFRPKFQESLRHGSPEWLNEADRRVSLRCLLSHSPSRNPMLKNDAKLAIARLFAVTPQLTVKQVCSKLDVCNERNPRTASIPDAWRKRGARSWSDAYNKLSSRVKPYVSKVRKEAGITPDFHRKQLPQLPAVRT